jgi:hypothetical protein
LILRDILAAKLTLQDIQAGRTAHLNPELRADLFALEHIQGAIQDSDRFIEAAPFQMLFSNATHNLSAERILGNFGALGAARRALFRDTSYSHPNLELRVRVLGYLTHPDPMSEHLLRSFLEERDKPRDAGVLFQAPGSSSHQLQNSDLLPTDSTSRPR